MPGPSSNCYPLSFKCRSWGAYLLFNVKRLWNFRKRIEHLRFSTASLMICDRLWRKLMVHFGVCLSYRCLAFLRVSSEWFLLSHQIRWCLWHLSDEYALRLLWKRVYIPFVSGRGFRRSIFGSAWSIELSYGLQILSSLLVVRTNIESQFTRVSSLQPWYFIF